MIGLVSVLETLVVISEVDIHGSAFYQRRLVEFHLGAAGFFP